MLVGQFLWGLGYTFTSGATQAWITDEIGEARAGQAFLRGSQAGQLGALIGIFVSVALGSLDLRVPILTGGVLFLGLAAFLAVTMPEHGFRPLPRGERSSWQSMAHTFRGGLSMIRLRPILLTILVIGVFYGLYSEGYDRLWTKHLLDQFTFPDLGLLNLVGWFGLIQLVEILLSTGAIEIVRRKLDTTSQAALVRLLMALTAVLSLSLLGFAWSSSLWLALGMVWLVGIMRTIIGPLYTTWVNQRLESSVRATVISMSSQVDAIGQIAGGPVVGMIGNYISVRAAISASALILTPLLAFFARTLRSAPVETIEEASPAS
jgi:DHA3 family tetracycline resistance protein-like MFS transporter